MYIKELGFQIQKTDIGVQKIDKINLAIYDSHYKLFF